MRHPPTRKSDVVDILHGVAVADPYRWLEDPDAEETAAWVHAQNAATAAFLADVPARDRIRSRLRQLHDYERSSRPVRRGGAVWFMHNDGLQAHGVLCRSTSPGGPRETVLDPNGWSADHTVGLSSWEVSRDGRWLAYGLSDGGTDWTTIRVRDLQTGEDTADEVRWAKFGGPEFLPDGSGFLYSRYPATAGTAVNRDHQVWLHRIGTSQDADQLVYARPDHPTWNLFASVTPDGAWVLIQANASSADTNGLFAAEIRADGIGPFRTISDRFDGSYGPIGNRGRTLLLETNAGAPRHRVVAVDVDHPEPEAWRVLVPEQDDTLLHASRAGDRLFCRYLHHATSRVTVHDLDGNLLGTVALPGLGSVDGFDGDPDDTDTFYTFMSYTRPINVFRYDLVSGTSSVLFAPTVPFDTEDLHTEQIFVKSADGTVVPAFVSWRGELRRDGSRPTLLYGYGGFDIPLVPQFEASLVAWFEVGGVYVVANLRGGGEYGRTWHEAGTKERKQNVFDDFVAVADHLVAERITSRERLAIHGHSNGGLLVGAVLVQHPERFGAAVPAVGVHDMLRYHLWTIGRAWSSDYGVADDPDAFRYLLRYSPVHNTKPADYPPTLVVTADHDDRVVPAHSFKFGAALQAAQNGSAPILMRIDTRAGHGLAKPLSKMLDERADVYAFLTVALRIDAPGAPS